MTTLNQIKNEQLQARKNKEAVKATLLTTFIGEIQGRVTSLPIDKRTEAKEAEIIQSCLTSFLKQNRESQSLVTDTEKLAILKQEEQILTVYEPQRMSAEEIKAIIQAKFPEINAKNKGPVIGYLKKEYGEAIDGAVAKQIVESLAT